MVRLLVMGVLVWCGVGGDSHHVCARPWAASSVTATMVAGRVVESQPAATSGCR